MASRISGLRIAMLSALLALCAGTQAAATPPARGVLRVCANTDNFPLSDRSGNGYENRLARLVAGALGMRAEFVWWPARENFLDRTLKAGRCDVVMGVPVGLPDVETTRPYYRSSYVFVSRAQAHLAISSLSDPRLRRLRVGVYVIGDNSTPPALALAEEGVSDNVKGYMTFFDRSAAGRDSALIAALQDGTLDIAAVWGPLVGFYARHAQVPLAVTPIADTKRFAPLVFRYDIAMGVRKGDDSLRRALDGVIAAHATAIANLLAGYGVPLLPMQTRQSTPSKRAGG